MQGPSHLGQFLHLRWSLQCDRVNWPGEGFIMSFLFPQAGIGKLLANYPRACVGMAPELRMDFTFLKHSHFFLMLKNVRLYVACRV